MTIPAMRMSLRSQARERHGDAAGRQERRIADVDALNRHKKELRALVARKRQHQVRARVCDSRSTRTFDAQARIDALLKTPQVARDLVRGADDKEEQ